MLETNEALRQQLLLGLRSHGIDAESVGTMEGLARLVQTQPRWGPEAVVVVGPDGGSIRDVVEIVSRMPDSKDHAHSSSATDGRLPEVIAILEEDAVAGGKVSGAPAPPDGSEGVLAVGLRAMGDGATDFVPMAARVASGASVDWMAGVAVAIRKAQARQRLVGRRPGKTGQPGQPGYEEGPAARRGSAAVVLQSASSSQSAPAAPATPVMVGASPKIAAVLTLVRRLAAVRTAVLVGGESGTGKELVAQALHDQSPWRAGPFVAVNCGAIPAGLIESELFGHVRGAFTDAVRDKRGLFQAAHGGTLFLDEIADLPLDLQSKLLRVLQDGIFRRVGDSEDLQVAVRVVAATARVLTAEVAARRFREDLYYRLAGITIQLPPLRERPADIPLLAMHFLARARTRLGVNVHDIDPEAMRLLTAYPWPGNVRELENTIERAAVLCSDGRVDVASLPERMMPATQAGGTRMPDGTAGGPGSRLVGGPLANLPVSADHLGGNLSIKEAARRSEQSLIRQALAATGGNRTKAAELLEISHRALLYKIKEYGIRVPVSRGPGGVG
ncbi:MAG: sigma-54 dependent transcriptional regulator [Myxococcales bacterium]